MTEYVNEENCTECVHHDIFWEGSGCNLLNNMEFCRFEQKYEKANTTGAPVRQWM